MDSRIPESDRASASAPLAYASEVGTPGGPVQLAVDADGSLISVYFVTGRSTETMEVYLTKHGFRVVPDDERTAEARRQLEEYFAGERTAFDLPLRFIGSEWQQAVWRALLTIPIGETRSYAEVAALAGRPGAARAAGRANATNPLPIVVPCHRVIGADGSLTGFGGGLEFKRLLLDHERAVAKRSNGGQLTLDLGNGGGA